MHTIVFITYPGIKLLDLAGPLQVFTDVPPASTGTPQYRLQVASVAGGMTSTDAGIAVSTVAMRTIASGKADTVLVVGGTAGATADTDAALLHGIRRLSRSAIRIGSICTGAFPLAATGLLDGKRVVTHWESCQQLAKRFPALEVETDPIYIKDGNIWSSAGVTAGLDMALALVAADLGQATAVRVAQSLVTPLIRSGSQSQYSHSLQQQSLSDVDRFAKLHRWMSRHLQQDLSVTVLAEQVHMSPRHFSRVYAQCTGQTPAKAVEYRRVQAARQLLQQSRLSVATVAERCGFMDDERMRRAFIRWIKVSPLQYRRQFQGAG